jgi:hypothetical protein
MTDAKMEDWYVWFGYQACLAGNMTGQVLDVRDYGEVEEND